MNGSGRPEPLWIGSQLLCAFVEFLFILCHSGNSTLWHDFFFFFLVIKLTTALIRIIIKSMNFFSALSYIPNRCLIALSIFTTCTKWLFRMMRSIYIANFRGNLWLCLLSIPMQNIMECYSRMFNWDAFS